MYHIHLSVIGEKKEKIVAHLLWDKNLEFCADIDGKRMPAIENTILFQNVYILVISIFCKSPRRFSFLGMVLINNHLFDK